MAGMMSIRRVSRILLSPIVWVIVILMGAGLFYGANRFTSADQTSNPLQYKGPSAKVGGVLIKDEDFNKVLGPLMQNYGQMYSPEQLRDEALKRCVNDEIIRQYIQKWHIKTSDQELNRFMQKQIYANYKTPEELQTLYSQVGVKNKGDLVNLVRQQLDRKNFFAELARRWKVSVSEDEVKAKYEQVELAHILIATNSQVKPNPPSDADALKKANEAYAKIKAGTDFATVAQEYSDDTSKSNGGNLGRHDLAGLKQQFDPDFMKAAEKLKVGEVSQPVKTQFGYHIIKMIDRTEAKGKEYNEVKGDLRRDALAEKLFSTKNDQLMKWLDKQANSQLEVLDPALRAYRLMKESKWSEAAEAYKKAIGMNQYKNDITVYASYAEALKQSKQFEEAISVLKKYPTTEGRPNIQIQMTMAEIYDAKGDKAAAKQLLNKEVSRAAEDIDSLRRIQGEMQMLKYDDEAKALAGKISEIQAKLDKEQADYEALIKKQQEAADQKNGTTTQNSTTTGTTTTDNNTTTNNTTTTDNKTK